MRGDSNPSAYTTNHSAVNYYPAAVKPEAEAIKPESRTPEAIKPEAVDRSAEGALLQAQAEAAEAEALAEAAYWQEQLQAQADAEADAEADAAARDAETPDAPPQRVGGCFLVYAEENQGTLRSYWSETEVEGALAVLRPGREVPRHKYTTNHGRSDILKQANLGVHKQRHCEGFAQFIKASRAFDSQLVIYSEEIRVVLALPNEGVLEASGTGIVDTSEALAICVAPRDVEAFSGIRKLNFEQFAFKAQHCGGGFVKF